METNLEDVQMKDSELGTFPICKEKVDKNSEGCQLRTILCYFA